MDGTLSFLQRFLSNIESVLMMPFTSDSRIFILYLVSSALFALFVYCRLRRTRSGEAISFLAFLFPRRVWNHPSAWLDVRYFFFHRITGHFVVTGGGIFATIAVFLLLTGGEGFSASSQTTVLTGWSGIGASIAFLLVAIIVADFTAFYVHYLQHKVPVLWQFHKVHHSAEVMHPLSNYREHPIDNLAYTLTNGATYGGVLALAAHVFGYVPETISILGAPIFMFLFNFTGYNLRHSHVWLRWPGRWSMVFPSPAHHQVHHSCHPDHLDKNFAFIFPVWDILFGCYLMPEDNRDVKFGVTEKDRGHELNSCLRIYFLPFRDAWVLLSGRRGRHLDPGSSQSTTPQKIAERATSPD